MADQGVLRLETLSAELGAVAERCRRGASNRLALNSVDDVASAVAVAAALWEENVLVGNALEEKKQVVEEAKNSLES